MSKTHEAHSDPHYDPAAILQPAKSNSSSKPSMDKLIDINHHLMRRVEELEEAIGLYMQRELHSNLERMRDTDGS